MKSAVLLMITRLFLMGTTVVAVGQAPPVNHNTWTTGTAIPTAVKFVMTGVLKNQIYVVGGVTDTQIVSDVQIYNPVTDSWSTGPALPVATFDGAAAVVKNVLYVFGGTQDGTSATNAVWAYNLKTKTWTSEAAMPTAAFGIEAVVEKNIIYVIGGDNSSGILDTVQSYNSVTNSWTEGAPLLVPNAASAVGLLGTTIVDADGWLGPGIGPTGDAEGYDATTNSWSTLASDPAARSSACYGSAKGSLYVAGGALGDGSPVDTTDSFKLTKNSWKSLASMPLAVTDAGSAVVKNVLYCIGGGSTAVQFQGTVYNNVQIYQP